MRGTNGIWEYQCIPLEDECYPLTFMSPFPVIENLVATTAEKRLAVLLKEYF